jgi:hypothetical protein
MVNFHTKNKLNRSFIIIWTQISEIHNFGFPFIFFAILKHLVYIYEVSLAVEEITRLDQLWASRVWALFLLNRFVVEFPISLSLLKVFLAIIWERWTYFLTSHYLTEYIKYYFFASKKRNKMSWNLEPMNNQQ